MQVSTPNSFPRIIRLARNWQVFATVLLSLLITISSYLVYQWQEQQQTASHARFDASEYSRTLWQGTQSYAHLNKDVAGLFAAFDEVTPRKFDDYIRRVQA